MHSGFAYGSSPHLQLGATNVWDRQGHLQRLGPAVFGGNQDRGIDLHAAEGGGVPHHHQPRALGAGRGSMTGAAASCERRDRSALAHNSSIEPNTKAAITTPLSAEQIASTSEP